MSVQKAFPEDTFTSEGFATNHYGPACPEKDIIRIDFCGKTIAVNRKCERAFKRFARCIKSNDKQTAALIRARADTGAYNCRHIGNDDNRPWSNHAFGIAADVLWQLNPFGNRVGYHETHMMGVIKTMEKEAFYWGGRWGTQDDMHFEVRLTPDEIRRRYFRSGRRKVWVRA